VRHLLALSRNRDRVVHKIKQNTENLLRVGQHDKCPASGDANLETFRRGCPQQIGDLNDRLDDIETTPPVRRNLGILRHRVVAHGRGARHERLRRKGDFAAMRAGKALERFEVQPDGRERIADIVRPLRRRRRVYRSEGDVPHGNPPF
jgi:hypothetical protein